MNPVRPIVLRGEALAGGTLPAIITPLLGATREHVLDEVEAIIGQSPDVLEWRVDFFAALGDIDAVLETARDIRAAAPGIPLLMTRRHVREGGQPIGVAEAQVVAVYAAACAARCVDLIDYELDNAADDLRYLRDVSRAHGVALIVSYHDFAGTPDAATLDAKFAGARRVGADVAKLAVMPRDADDVFALLAATERARQALDIPLISMSMAEIGALSRIVGWLYGSAATFAVGRNRSAPGQLAIGELRAAIAALRRALDGGEEPRTAA